LLPFLALLLLLLSSAFAADPPVVAVVNTGEGSVSFVDLEARREVRRLPVGERPYGVAFNRDRSALAVGVEGEEKLKFYRYPSLEPWGELSIGKMFNDHLILSQDGRHWMLADYHSDSVIGVDVESRQESFRITGLSAPHVIKYGPRRAQAYVTCKKVTGLGIVDPVTRQAVRFLPTNVNPRSLTFSADESRLYFGSFWVDGIFELEVASGKVTRLLRAHPPDPRAAPQEVTYHGVEMVEEVLLAANEGRSYLDAFRPADGTLLSRLTDVSRPCCVERIPGQSRVLVSNLGDSSVQIVEVSADGRLTSVGRIAVGQAPKRVAFTFGP